MERTAKLIIKGMCNTPGKSGEAHENEEEGIHPIELATVAVQSKGKAPGEKRDEPIRQDCRWLLNQGAE